MASETLCNDKHPLPAGYGSPEVDLRLLEKRSKLLEDIDRIIEMAWEDRTPFDAIRFQFGLTEQEVRNLMKTELRFGSYIRWRKRVESCATKHGIKRNQNIMRFRSAAQRLIR